MYPLLVASSIQMGKGCIVNLTSRGRLDCSLLRLLCLGMIHRLFRAADDGSANVNTDEIGI